MSDNNQVNKMDVYKQTTITLETVLESEQGNWNKIISSMIFKMKSDIKYIHDAGADAINYSQLVTADIRKYALIIHKENKLLKGLIKSRFEWYSTQYQITVKNSGDKMKLIESDVAEIQYKIDLLDTHIDYLKTTGDNLKQMGYTIKNRIELLNILGAS